jgi:hypothetical protein
VEEMGLSHPGGMGSRAVRTWKQEVELVWATELA